MRRAGVAGACVAVVLGSTGCPGPTDEGPFTVGGSVQGLTGTLVLQNGLADDLTLTGDGPFVFGTPIPDGAAYSVTVKSAPAWQTCAVTSARGTIRGGDVRSVSVMCTYDNVMFVTSAGYPGNLGGLAGADAKCAAHAAAAGLAGTYRAYLYTSTVYAYDRIAGARGWVRPDGKPFADTSTDVGNGRLFYPPMLDETGAVVNADVFAWSGYSISDLCADFTSSLATNRGAAGDPSTTTEAWMSIIHAGCDQSLRLYCFGVDRSYALTPAAAGRLAFISAGSFVPGGGLAAADQLCQAEAEGAGITGRTFKALLATESATAASRFSLTGATWVRPDGVAIVANAAELATARLDAPINVTLAGSYVGWEAVWAGATSLAAAGSASTCADWSSSSSAVKGWAGIAPSPAIGTYSTYDTLGPCSTANVRLHCLEE